jgi:rSAM/selenodomain-associated transferase 1
VSTLAVLAKSPVPGRVKTRLCPPLGAADAARLAEAALRDTLAAVAATPCDRRLLVLEGRPGPWLPRGFDVVAQCDGGLGTRLAGAFAAAGGRTVLVGMDTPQLTPTHLADALARLADDATDAVIGCAPDGGYWAIGFDREQPGAFTGVPMSTDRTGDAQRRRLAELGVRVALLPQLRDVDHYADAEQVARAAPATRFAAAFRAVAHDVVPA